MFSIRYKILLVFLVIILFFAGNSIFNAYYLNLTQKATTDISNLYQPSIIKLSEFNLMITKSKNFTNSWVKIDIDHPDKRELKKLHNEDYPNIRKELFFLVERWQTIADRDSLKAILVDFETILDQEKAIMKTMSSYDDYLDLEKIFEVTETLEIINENSNKLQVRLQVILDIQKDNTKTAEVFMLDSFENLGFSSSTLGFIVILICVIIAIFIAQSITNPIVQLQQIMGRISRGELPDDELQKPNDEIGSMIRQVDLLIDGLKKTSNFAQDIGEGSFDTKYDPLSDKDVLGNSLLTMRDNLKEAAEQDLRRNWANEGFAKFGDILRQFSNDELETLTYEVVSNIVKYLDINQGWLYVIAKNEETGEDQLELMACYAYDKKKYINKTIEFGEGLTGQVWQEGEMIYMNDVPNNFVNITSGLGQSNPTSILIMPLKMNDEIHGMLELGSFRDLKKHEIEFVERVSGNIASTISVSRVNAKTKELLSESQHMSESLRSQEEEMRQNLEELQATQDEMHRKTRELELSKSTMGEQQREELDEARKLALQQREVIEKLTNRVREKEEMIEILRQKLAQKG